VYLLQYFLDFMVLNVINGGMTIALTEGNEVVNARRKGVSNTATIAQ
jgi:hypothetical protein